MSRKIDFVELGTIHCTTRFAQNSRMLNSCRAEGNPSGEKNENCESLTGAVLRKSWNRYFMIYGTSVQRTSDPFTVPPSQRSASKCGTVCKNLRCCKLSHRHSQRFADLMVGHTTWDDYSRMLRVFKYYNFPLGPETMATSSD